MNFRAACLKLPWSLAVLAGLTTGSAPAQQALFPPGQAIVFSTPDSGVTSNLPSLSPQPPTGLDFGGSIQSPAFNPGGAAAAGPLAAPAGGMMPSPEMLDRRNNWILMTPAEILGATTPEKILGIVDRDITGQPKNLTVTERYLARQNQARMQLTYSNALGNANASPGWNFSDNPLAPSLNSPGGLDAAGNPLLNPMAGGHGLAVPGANNRWSQLVGSRPPAQAPVTAQQSDMDRFRQLLKSGLPAPDPDATAAAWNNTKSTLPQSAFDASLGTALDRREQQRPSTTPIGASFAPLSDGIRKAAEMPRLPALSSLSYTSAPPAAAWMPVPAPWLSPAPQPFGSPQRKF